MKVIEFYVGLKLERPGEDPRFTRITSPYGMRTLDGVTRMHRGCDVGGGWRFRNFPTPVPRNSLVTYVQHGHSSYGNRVIFRPDGADYDILISHLHSIDVKVGDRMLAGESIGGMGMTGTATGDHWHIEVRGFPAAGKAANQGSILGDPEKFYLPTSTMQAVHVVESGEVMWRIAEAYGVPLNMLIAANPHIEDPNLIRAGDKLNIPRLSPDPAPAPGDEYETLKVHEVVSGDTMGKLALHYGVPLDVLILVNGHISNPDRIYPGDEIVIPVIPADPPGSEAELQRQVDRLLQELQEHEKERERLAFEKNQALQAGREAHTKAEAVEKKAAELVAKLKESFVI